MSWAARRRLAYIIGIVLFFVVTIGFPIAYSLLTVPPTCADGMQNQNETGIDVGGICPRIDVRSLSPVAPVWARSFRIREGLYTAASYIQNSNELAGALSVGYRFKLYDSENVLVAERNGSTFIMPGGITPIIESNIDTGYRTVTHTFFEFTTMPVWEKYIDVSTSTTVYDRKILTTDTEPRIEAKVENTSVTSALNIAFAAVVFDTAGNAIAASQTELDRLDPNTPRQIVFTWPVPWAVQVGRVDILPILPPKRVR